MSETTVLCYNFCRMKRQGFTVLEIIVVIVAVVILLAIVYVMVR